MKFEVGDTKIIFRDEISIEIVPNHFWDDFSWGRFSMGRKIDANIEMKIYCFITFPGVKNRQSS